MSQNTNPTLIEILALCYLAAAIREGSFVERTITYKLSIKQAVNNAAQALGIAGPALIIAKNCLLGWNEMGELTEENMPAIKAILSAKGV